MDISNLPTPRRQLWSARRCAVFFVLGVAVFVGVVGWAGSAITVHPVTPARLVEAAETDGWRVEVDESAVEKYGPPIRVTQPMQASVAGQARGYRPPVAVGSGGVIEDASAVAEWASDEPVEAVFEKRSLWGLAWKAVGL